MGPPAHKLLPGEPFFAVVLYDRTGYYSSVIARTEAEVRLRTGVRTKSLGSLVACTVPFHGHWAGQVPDVSTPPEYKADLRALERERSGDE
jgi:hypothetical protein